MMKRNDGPKVAISFSVLLILLIFSQVALASPRTEDLIQPAKNSTQLDHDESATAANCADDSFEENDTSTTAATLAYGSSHQNLMSCADDLDFYQVSVAANSNLYVAIYFSDDISDLDLSVSDSTGADIENSTSTSDNEAVQLVNTSNSAAIFTIQVNNHSGIDNAYSLTVGATPDCGDDAFEENDTQETAAPITIAAGPYNGLLSCIGDSDYYSIVVPANSAIQVDVTFSHATSDIDAEILDSNSTELTDGTSVSDNESVVIENSNSTPATYFLHVYNYGNTAHTPYSIAFSNNNSITPCVDDAFEDNDTLATAAPISIGGSPYMGLTHCPRDNDAYTLTVPPLTAINVDLIFSHSVSDLDIEVYDNDGITVAGAYTTSDNESLLFLNRSTTAKNYSIVVYSIDRSGNNVYSLEIEVNSTLRIPVRLCEQYLDTCAQ